MVNTRLVTTGLKHINFRDITMKKVEAIYEAMIMREGMRAMELGEEEDTCPYPSQTYEYYVWLSGYKFESILQ